jgi:hypothetical protein
MLGSTDYTATNGTTVVLAVGALVGDLISTESFYVSSVLNAIPATAGAVNSSYIASGITLTSPVLVTPALGTPASGVLTNCTGVAKAALPTGSVLQVVNVSYSTLATNITSTYATSGLTASITPSSSSSKILVFVDMAGTYKSGNTALQLRLYRGATSIFQFEDIALYNALTQFNAAGSCSTNYLDSPSTTASTTYTIYFASANNTSLVQVQSYLITAGNSASTITLMEIAA